LAVVQASTEPVAKRFRLRQFTRSGVTVAYPSIRKAGPCPRHALGPLAALCHPRTGAALRFVLRSPQRLRALRPRNIPPTRPVRAQQLPPTRAGRAGRSSLPSVRSRGFRRFSNKAPPVSTACNPLPAGGTAPAATGAVWRCVCCVWMICPRLDAVAHAQAVHTCLSAVSAHTSCVNSESPNAAVQAFQKCVPTLQGSTTGIMMLASAADPKCRATATTRRQRAHAEATVPALMTSTT
jgi:hypothetical protein